MCGIGAIYNYKGKNSDDILDINSMMEEVKSRGPDAYKKYYDNKVILGHRRLSIIDLNDRSNQPFLWRDRFVIIFNGAIYNYKEIRDELINVGYEFKTSSDTEVLIAAYSYWGEKCQNKFNGMWAFIIWDKKEEKLFASRDRFGIKPLYWTTNNGRVFFASEIKQLRKLGFGKNPNISELSKFIYTGIVNSSENTCFKNIKKLPPGFSLIIEKNKKYKFKKWYFLNDHKPVSTDKSKIIDLIYNSIVLRTRGDVNIGTLLSGGLDSSFITSLLSKFSKKSNLKFKIFHGSSSNFKTNESYYARYLCKRLDKNLNIKTPSYKEFRENIKKICYAQDEPFGSTSIFMQYFVMKEVKKNKCKILLDGQGADEILLGYKKYLSLPIYKNFRKRNFKKLVINLIHIYKRNSNLSLWMKLQYIFGPLLENLRIFIVARRLNFIKLPLQSSRIVYKEISRKSWDFKKMQTLEIFNTSLPSLLRFADRNSMLNNIELRLPFLDHRVVEECLNLSLEEKINYGWDKYLLRIAKILPKKIAWRESKLGFASPQDEWINKYSKEMLEEILNSRFVFRILNIHTLRKRWGKLKYEEKWRLYNVAIWFKIMNLEY